MPSELSTNVTSADDAAMLEKATQILEVLKTAYQLGWVLTLPPEQMQVLIAILENAVVRKPDDSYMSNVS